MKAAPTLSVIPLVAAAALAGCASNEVSSSSGLEKRPQIATQQLPYKPGSGVVQSWSAAPSPAVGASGRVDPRVDPSGGGMLRLGIKMDDGTLQYVDTDSRDFPIGSRVQLTDDRIIRRP